MIHLVVGPDRGAQIAGGVAMLVDLAAEHAGAHVPARGRTPVVVDAEHGRLAIKVRTIHAGHHHAQVLVLEITHQPQRVERAPHLVRLVGGKHAVLGLPERAVELDRGGDVARATAIVGRPADPAGIQQLAEIRRRGVFEQPLVLGEERSLVADEGFGGAEVDHQVIAFHLAEIGIERGGHLELAVGLPEQIHAAVEIAVTANVVVQARCVRRDRQQRLAVPRHFDRRELGQEP